METTRCITCVNEVRYALRRNNMHYDYVPVWNTYVVDVGVPRLTFYTLGLPGCSTVNILYPWFTWVFHG